MMSSLLGVLAVVVFVVPFWRICGKAGYPGWLALLIVLPIANIALLYFLAFAEWPLERSGPRPRIDRPA